jgi:hypothetical protein
MWSPVLVCTTYKSYTSRSTSLGNCFQPPFPTSTAFLAIVRRIPVLTNLNCLSLPYGIVDSKLIKLGTVNSSEEATPWVPIEQCRRHLIPGSVEYSTNTNNTNATCLHYLATILVYFAFNNSVLFVWFSMAVTLRLSWLPGFQGYYRVLFVCVVTDLLFGYHGKEVTIYVSQHNPTRWYHRLHYYIAWIGRDVRD